MIDMTWPHTVDGCDVCEDNDHCLPRWEDDGGRMGRPPPFGQAFEKDSERDQGHHDRPYKEKWHQTI